MIKNNFSFYIIGLLVICFLLGFIGNGNAVEIGPDGECYDARWYYQISGRHSYGSFYPETVINTDITREGRNSLNWDVLDYSTLDPADAFAVFHYRANQITGTWTYIGYTEHL